MICHFNYVYFMFISCLPDSDISDQLLVSGKTQATIIQSSSGAFGAFRVKSSDSNEAADMMASSVRQLHPQR